MRIYLAGRYSRRVELCGYRQRLQDIGHTVTSRWLNGKHQLSTDGLSLGAINEEFVEPGNDARAAELRAFFAGEDVQDVGAADLLIAFTEEPRAEASRGGRHVECGIAIGLGLAVAIVGPRENVFHWLPYIRHFDSFDELLQYLSTAL